MVLYAATYAEPVLRVSVMPDQPPPVLRRKLEPLIDYLGKRVGIKMEFRPMLSGDTLVDALLRHKLDLVWIDGANLARARLRKDGQVIPLVRLEAGDYAWAVRADMDANLRQKLTDAFLSLSRNSSPGREILDMQHVHRYIPAGR